MSIANNVEIKDSEVIKAQKEWGTKLVAIGKAYTDKKNYREVAENLIDKLYAYQLGEVLFKPTKAAKIKFRTGKEGALSYFVGHNSKFPEDKGFALQPWTKVEFKNAGIFVNGDVAFTMGEYYFTPLKGEPVTVEYTFGYIKDEKGDLRIVLHHSSLPYAAK